MTSTATLAIRPADALDATDVARLAVLDSSATPAEPLLLGIVDGHPVAALSLATGAVVADPFAPTAELVALMRQRATRLRGPRPARRGPRAGLAGRLRRGSPVTV